MTVRIGSGIAVVAGTLSLIGGVAAPIYSAITGNSLVAAALSHPWIW